jgi:hypothetical protein
VSKKSKGGGKDRKMYDAQARINDALKGSSPPLAFDAAVVDRVEPGWDVVTRPDGLRVRLDPYPAATEADKVTARALVLGLDLTAVALTSAEVLALRAAAKTLFDALDAEGKRDRAIAWLLVNQLNTLRSWDASFKAAVAASVSLTDLKARVALLPDLGQISLSAARQALRDLLDAGTADAPPP